MTGHPDRFLSLDAELRLIGLGPETGPWLRRRWGYASGSGPSRVVEIRSGRVPTPPAISPQQVPVAGLDVPCWVQGEQVWITQDLHLKFTDQDAVLTVAAGALHPDLWLLALAEVHRVGGWLMLHAAVLMNGHKAIGLTGVSGAGKSTAALRLAAEGVEVMAEDQAWVRPADGLTVGLDLYLRALPDTLAWFAPHLLERAVGQDHHGKHLLPVLEPGQSAQLQTLLVFGLPEDASKALQARAVWESVGVPLTAAGRRATASGISALLSHLRIEPISREDAVPRVLARLRQEEQ